MGVTYLVVLLLVDEHDEWEPDLGRVFGVGLAWLYDRLQGLGLDLNWLCLTRLLIFLGSFLLQLLLFLLLFGIPLHQILDCEVLGGLGH